MNNKMKNIVFPLIIILAGVLIGGLACYYLLSQDAMFSFGKERTSPEKLSEEVVNFLNEEILGGESSADLSEGPVLENGLYKIKLNIDGTDLPYYSYVTLDGKMLFPFGGDVMLLQGEEEEKAVSCEDLKKQDSPSLEAFVVSYCPYGTQMQRIFVEIAKEIPLLSDYLSIRYMWQESGDGTISSMHGEEETDENLVQTCIREEQEEKYFSYLSCFLKEGNRESCLAEADIDENALIACRNDSERGIKYAREDFDLMNEYNDTEECRNNNQCAVGGSPALILNSESVSEFDFGGRTAEAVKTLLCCGFSEEKDFCQNILSEEQAAAGFSPNYSGEESTSSGSCE
jgi:hypothetical protein